MNHGFWNYTIRDGEFNGESAEVVVTVILLCRFMLKRVVTVLMYYCKKVSIAQFSITLKGIHV